MESGYSAAVWKEVYSKWNEFAPRGSICFFVCVCCFFCFLLLFFFFFFFFFFVFFFCFFFFFIVHPFFRRDLVYIKMNRKLQILKLSPLL